MNAVERFRAGLEEEYRTRFPVSWERWSRAGRALLDDTSHAVRWNEPFMPLAVRARGPHVETVDGPVWIDYWQGHFANLFGHNPTFVREELAAALQEGRGLQTGFLHEVESEVAELVRATTGMQAVRFTTSGTLGTFYATVAARAFTGREHVLKVSGGWHGSQPYGLVGVTPEGDHFRGVESEGLSSGLSGELLVTRFNDLDMLRSTFAAHGDGIACVLVEPVMGAAGGLVATHEYLTELRTLTERHGALWIADEIITAYRYRPGDLCAHYGVRPDLLILGKALGGGMPVAAVAGRRDVLDLCTRRTGRVKFEGGTYSAHELSLIAARTVLRKIVDEAPTIYPALFSRAERLRIGLEAAAARAGLPVAVTGVAPGVLPGCAMLMVHPLREPLAAPARSPEDLLGARHPTVDGKLLKSVLLLHDLSVRSGLGALTTAHDDDAIDRTVARFEDGLGRLRGAGLLGAV